MDTGDKLVNLDDLKAVYDAKVAGLWRNERLYPFNSPIDTPLYLPGSEGNAARIIFSGDKMAIKELHIDTPSDERFYINTCYSYNANDHGPHFVVYSFDRSLMFSYVGPAWASKSYDAFTETTFTVTGTDGVSTLKATIDWSKILYSTGSNMSGNKEAFAIAEDCISRTHCLFVPINEYYVGKFKQRLYLNELAMYSKNGYFTITVAADTNSAQLTTYPELASFPYVTTGDNGESQYIEFDYSSVTTPTALNFALNLTIDYYYNNSWTVSKTLTVRVRTGNSIGANSVKRKFLFIGDSLTNNGYMLSRFYVRNATASGVELYGTRTTTIGSNVIAHEGRPGWSAQQYCTLAEKNGETNPFYNSSLSTTNKFDFSYYMANAGSEFADVDCVVIFLGRNDGYNAYANLTGYLDAMIASIKAYATENSTTIHIYVMGGYNVACNNSGAGRYLQNSYQFVKYAHVYNAGYFYPKYLAAGSDAKPIPAHLALDNKFDFATEAKTMYESVDGTVTRTMDAYTDNVHPNDQGYLHLGEALSAFFHYEVTTW